MLGSRVGVRGLREDRAPLAGQPECRNNMKRFQGSALVTLGVTVGDVGAWLFVLWVCMEWILNLDAVTEATMKATIKTGLDALAVLWA